MPHHDNKQIGINQEAAWLGQSTLCFSNSTKNISLMEILNHKTLIFLVNIVPYNPFQTKI